MATTRARSAARRPRLALAALAPLAGLALAAGRAVPEDVASAAQPFCLLVCYPGEAGTTKSAQGTMDGLAHYLEARSGVKDLRAKYFNAAEPGLKWKQEEKPEIGILSLSCYLRWKKAGEAMTVLAVSERRGQATERFHVVVNAAAGPKDLAGLAGKTILSNHADDAKFVTKVVFDDSADGKAVKLEFARSVLEPLRKCAKGEPGSDAVLVDDAQLEFLNGPALAEVKSGLRTVFSSRALPFAPIVAFAAAPSPAALKVQKAFLGMAGDGEDGKRVLGALLATGFGAATDETYAAAAKDHAR